MTEPNTIRGSRMGAGPMREADRGEGAPRTPVSFWCASLAPDPPELRRRRSDTRDLGVPPGAAAQPAKDQHKPAPPRPRAEPYRTHLAYVKERRSPAEGEAILAEALARLHRACSAHTDLPGLREPVTAGLPLAGAWRCGSRDAQDPPRTPGRPPAACRCDRWRPTARTT